MIESLIKKFLLARQIDFGKGYINVLKQPVTMQPIKVWTELRKKLEKDNRTSILYYAAKEGSKEWFLAMYRYAATVIG